MIKNKYLNICVCAKILKDFCVYEESPELVHQLLYRVLQSNLPFHCDKDNDSPHASLHQVPPLHPIG